MGAAGTKKRLPDAQKKKPAKNQNISNLPPKNRGKPRILYLSQFKRVERRNARCCGGRGVTKKGGKGLGAIGEGKGNEELRSTCSI